MRAALICVLAAALAGCNVGSALDDDEETFHIRSLNLIEDSATVNVLLGDTTIASIGYSSGSAFSAARPGSLNVSFKAVLPPTLDDEDDDDDPVKFGETVVKSFVRDTPYTLIAYGSIASPQLFFIEGSSQRTTVADDKVALQFSHAAPDAPQVDVYLALPQAGVAALQLVATLDLAQASEPLEFTLVRDADDLDDDSSLAGELTIELRAVGSDQALFRSTALTISEQNRILFTIADSSGPGPSSVKLLSLVSGSVGEYFDHDDGAAMRFVHVSAQTPSLDIAVGPDYSTPVVQNMGFRDSSDYIDVKREEVGIVATQAGTSGILFLEEFTTTAGLSYSAYALGTLADVDAVVFANEARSVPTQNKFRFLHAAASLMEAEPVDIYLTLPGEGLDFDDDTTATFSYVAYQNTTNYLTYKEGSYDVYFAYAGTSTLILGPVSFQTSNGDIETLVLLDDENGGHELMPVSDVRL